MKSGYVGRLLAAMGLAAAACGTASAQGSGAAEPPLSLQQEQQMRYPQPVKVGDLRGEQVIQAGERQQKLGRIVGVFRPNAGDLQVVFRYAGLFGYGAREVAEPLPSASLVGPLVKFDALDRRKLAALPTFTDRDGAFLATNAVIRMGVARKY